MKVKIPIIRRATQIFAFFWANSFLNVFLTRRLYKGPLKGTCVPFLNCHGCPTATFGCPIGTIEHYMVIRRFPYEIVGQLGLLGMLVGRMACGWLCPFGLLQDLLFMVTKVEVKIAQAWRHVRWFVLVGLVILLPWIIGDDIFSKVCPVGILTADLPWILWNPLDPNTGKPMFASVVVWAIAINLAILVAILVLSTFIKRPFCRVLCPLGHIFSLFNKVSLVRLEVAPGCDHCDACEKVCPVGLKVYEDPNSSECVRCLSCTVCGNVKVGSRRLVPIDQALAIRKVTAESAPPEASGAGDTA